MGYIKTYHERLNETNNDGLNKEFIDNVLHVLNSMKIRYEERYRDTSILYSSLKITLLVDDNFIKDMMKNFDIKMEDFIDYDKFLNSASEFAQLVCFYERGSVRDYTGHSIATFNPKSPDEIKKGINNALNSCEYTVLKRLISDEYFKPENFVEKLIAINDLNPSFIKSAMNDDAFNTITSLRKRRPDIYCYIAHELLFYSFLAFSRDSKISVYPESDIFINLGFDWNTKEKVFFSLSNDFEVVMNSRPINNFDIMITIDYLINIVNSKYLTSMEKELGVKLDDPKNWKPVEQLVEENKTGLKLSSLGF